MASVLRTRALGICFLALVVGGVWMTYAVFTQKFTDFDRVTLETTSVGLQLPDRADVKVRGVIVGEVLKQQATGGGAKLTLGIKPDEIDTIPANVTGSILPKTLFGEKYVSLVVPDEPKPTAIKPGATIARTAVATELDSVLSDLYPLLRAVQPADLNMTLNALATALEGRGEELGSTIETADAYLKRLNPQIPALVEDLKKSVTVADTYNSVIPELSSILRNTITTTGTLEDNSAQLHALLTNVTTVSGTAREFLATNENNLIRLADINDGLLKTAARYSTEFPCLLGGLENLGKREADAFRNYTLHIVLETLPQEPRRYTPADQPHYGEDRGPACGHLPSPPWSQKNPLSVVPSVNDGVSGPVRRAPLGADFFRNGFGYAGSPAESEVYDQLLAPGLGVAPTQVPDLGGLLVGPMARGATVGLAPASGTDAGTEGSAR
ncbi:phospholipid/cholesterol/gamma-HCH transport system substrate-binding protein [Nocardioides terrae]|uniref:Phospholipid/cholesterol/gamma-HCH transport system substrate-binding protein n=1 Tax=Nocardioides terrae TaxID=574651 RepID=A0A1I1KHW8_9ACTN|nr:MCE family protein [Nocardioides terrae]SFC60397.1 phospholipid/cholesterol/gamma-HCH transport system substrate-binding protein [Nocardioides terrae]